MLRNDSHTDLGTYNLIRHNSADSVPTPKPHLYQDGFHSEPPIM